MARKTLALLAIVSLMAAALPPPTAGARPESPSRRAVSAAGSGGVTRIEIARREPFADGMDFGQTGPYERLVGVAYLEVDPTDPHYAEVVDLDKAPRNERGMVEVSTDLYILRQVDMQRANGRIFFEVNNRGNKQSLGTMNDAPAANANDPSTPAEAGNGFLMREGYTIVWAGWQGDVTPAGDRMTIRIPTATDDGAEITGPVAGGEYATLVPRVDADGSDLEGLRRPDDIQRPRRLRVAGDDGRQRDAGPTLHPR